MCPLQSFRLSRDCGNLCNSDADCEVDSKCCFSGCDKLKRCVKSCPSRCPPCLPGEKQIFKIGRDGCQTCSCHYHKCPALLCPRRCDFGYQRDTDGCLSCNCKPPPCSSPKCSRPCLTAYLNDENGCPTCRCRPRIPCPLTRCPFGCPWYRHKIRRNMLGCQECICMKE